MNKLLPLFSDNFRKLLEVLNSKYDSNIGKHLSKADLIIEGFNSFCPSEAFVEMKGQKADYIKLWEEMSRNKLSEFINESARMISMRINTFELSFLPKGKQPEYNQNGKDWSRKNRQTGKPTRILKRLINSRDFTDVDFETFNNQLRAIVDQEGEFRIVTGNDIRFWYHYENYYEDKSTLGNSCMKHTECQDYFEIYERHAKMLVLIKEDKLLGRALVWEIDGKTYMDRVYTCMDHLQQIFLNYAEDNKWYYRESQSAIGDGEEPEWYGPSDDYAEPQIHELTIRVGYPEYFPYMDSFRYYYSHGGRLSTSMSLEGDYDCLSNTDGTCGNRISTYCADCGYEERHYEDDSPENLYYSECDDEYYCDQCGIWSEQEQTYIRRSRAVTLHENRTNTSWIVDGVEYDEVVKIDDEYYHIDHPDVKYNEKTDIYYLVD